MNDCERFEMWDMSRRSIEALLIFLLNRNEIQPVVNNEEIEEKKYQTSKVTYRIIKNFDQTMKYRVKLIKSTNTKHVLIVGQ